MKHLRSLREFLDKLEKIGELQSIDKEVDCLLADRFPADERPVASDFAHNWSAETQQHVLDNWQKYGYR